MVAGEDTAGTLVKPYNMGQDPLSGMTPQNVF